MELTNVHCFFEQFGSSWNLIEPGIIEAFVYPKWMLVFSALFAQCVITFLGPKFGIIIFTRKKKVTNCSNPNRIKGEKVLRIMSSSTKTYRLVMIIKIKFDGFSMASTFVL
ncbi:C-C motif chemokine [Dirofilaria immitis]